MIYAVSATINQQIDPYSDACLLNHNELFTIMADPYQTFNSPEFLGAFEPYYTNAQGQPILQPSGFYDPNQQYQRPILGPLATPFPDYEEANRPSLNAHGSSRVRKRVGGLGEHVKFRRTRSGCFTCRNRRVKCDEARPVCERCRKGGRECVYPESSSSSKTRRGSTKSRSADRGGSSPNDGEGDGEDPLFEEDESPPAEPSSATSSKAERSIAQDSMETPALTHGVSPTPSIDESEPLEPSVDPAAQLQDAGATETARSSTYKKWVGLPGDLRFYLTYSRTKLDRHYWGLKMDPNNFIGNTLIEVALNFEPLLYAVVGFAAYHYTLTKPDGRLHDFLGYYQKSVNLLRQHIKQKPTIATILTILQLATIEEYLGDWVNLMSHQKAAFQLITELYSPEAMTKTDSLRKTLQWYIRFDTFVGIMSGTGTQLSRDWFEEQYSYFVRQCQDLPTDLTAKYEERFSWIRLTGYDMSQLVRNRAKGTIPEQEFFIKIELFQQRLQDFRLDLHPALKDQAKLLPDISGGRQRDPNDIVNPFEPNLLFGEDIFDTNILLMDFYGFELIFNNQLAALQGKPDPMGARNTAMKICQIFEAIQEYQGSPPGIVLGMQAGLALAVLFLPQEESEILWARKKIATIEALGYTYPTTLRVRMEQLWSIDLSEWWLPNREGQPPMLRQIRKFMTTKPIDEKGEDLRDMKGILMALSLDTSSPEIAQQNPGGADRPVLSRQSSSKAQATSAHSDGLITASAFHNTHGGSPEYDWS
ncbi:hypothetical protein EJ08DRAFT_60436 [Tothia fuscella]|uniref:Zn(2)-C6 fungal-type domain-containing protein n=1 Tax=Tothia fuscella TaxID=1048955 RepID=A0A9P4NXR0_9PEZI|nr:hypothetical protein EJ08DRAFT_60436 [Tothia fuscella]